MPPASDERSDQELVEAAGSGDASAFEALYRRHRDWTVHLAQGFVRDRDDALDVMQDAFEHVLARLPRFTLTTSLRGYLFPVVKHLSLTLLRRRGRHVAIEEADRVALPALPDTDAARLVARLPEGQREVVQLRFAHDLKLEEIAEVLGIPLGTVKSRLHLALQAMRVLTEDGTP